MSNYNQDLLLEQQNTITKLTAENARLHQQVAGLQSDLEREMVRYTEVEAERNGLRQQVEGLEREIFEFAGIFFEYKETIAAKNGEKITDVLRSICQRLAAQPVAVEPNPLGYASNLAIRNFEKGLADELSIYRSHAACLDEEVTAVFAQTIERSGWREFIERIAKQKPEKPDYWSSCGQCESNTSDAEDLLEAITAPPSQARPVELEVWFGSMPESNGRENWTVMLRRKSAPDAATGAARHHLLSGFCVCRSEYKDRMRYEADRLRFLLGEIGEEPDILAYDAELHSGYVDPAAQARPEFDADDMQEQFEAGKAAGRPVVPEGWKLVPVEPTPKMVAATYNDPIETSGKAESHNTRNKRVWAAMLTAAPAAQAKEKPE